MAQTPEQKNETIQTNQNGVVVGSVKVVTTLVITAVAPELHILHNPVFNAVANEGLHKAVEEVVVGGVEHVLPEPKEPSEPVDARFLHPTPGFVLENMAHFFSFGLLFNKPPPPVETTPVKKVIDPNGKITSGFGDQGFIPAGAAVTYTIYFENQPTATAPAVIVTVTDPLANNLDWSTVQFNNISFNNVSLNVPAGVATYSTQANVSTDPNPVNVTAAVNPATGVLTVTMQSVDPTTGSLPADPMAGFLPPNNASNQGTGYVTFSVKPKTGLANGTAITNQASIVFDVNAAIATNTVTNTLDSSSLTSAITPLPATTTSTNISVAWTGSDPSGSGIASYNIYVSTNGGAYALWLSATTLTSSTYTGIPGQTYSFLSLATNNVGTVQATPGTPQTITITSAAPNVTLTPASSSIGVTQSLAVAIAVASPVTGGSVPTGTVVLSSGTYTSATATLSSGASSITIPAGALPAGVDILTATYTPDSASSATYAAAAGVVQVTVGTVANVPLASLSPSGLTFTAVSGTSSAAQTVQLTNAGNAALTITGVTIAGTGASSFADTSACGTSLPAGFSCNISVTFTPSSVAAFSATLSIADNAAASPQTISLIGTGTPVLAPVASVTPSSLTFTATSGVSSAAQTVTLSNTGNAALSITAITLGGTGASSFSQTNTCGTSLAAGSNCLISITFTPSSAAAFSATLSIADNASGSPQTVSLTGTGTAVPAPIVSITPASLTFIATTGNTSAVQTAQLTNSGNAPLTITGIGITGAGAGSFTQTNTCGTSLAAGTNCLISLTFTPTSVASFAANLSVTDNAAGSPQSITLTGTGSASPTFQLTATPSSLTVPVGGSASYTIKATPQGGTFAGTVSLAVAGLPTGATATFQPSVITPGSAGASSTLTVQVPTRLAGLRSTDTPIAAFALLGVLLVGHRRRRFLAGCILALVMFMATTTLSGCGSGGGNNSATYTLTVTASSGAIAQTTVVVLTVQ
jgi:hypothetical protein